MPLISGIRLFGDDMLQVAVVEHVFAFWLFNQNATWSSVMDLKFASF
jgi:hypothetical protein